MEVGAVHVTPSSDATEAWKDDVSADITALFDNPVVKPKKKVVVKARRRVAVKGSESEPVEEVVRKLRVRPRKVAVETDEDGE